MFRFFYVKSCQLLSYKSDTCTRLFLLRVLLQPLEADFVQTNNKCTLGFASDITCSLSALKRLLTVVRGHFGRTCMVSFTSWTSVQIFHLFNWRHKWLINQFTMIDIQNSGKVEFMYIYVTYANWAWNQPSLGQSKCLKYSVIVNLMI